MPSTSGCWRRTGIVLACLVTLAWAPGDSAPAAEPPKDYWKEGIFYGVGTCMNCHLKPRAPFTTKLALLTEYTTWRCLDKHAQAYAVLEGPRGQRMGELLGSREHAVDVTKPEAGCLNCHALNVEEKRRVELFSVKDGVSCDACHGPAEGWLREHAYETGTFRAKSPRDKSARGMRDLRDPVTKAKLCMSCHVGDAAEGKVVTHAMFAAGHPPLPSFDLDLFCRNLPQHWRDPQDVPLLQDPVEKGVRERYRWAPTPVARVRRSVSGSLVALQDTMALIADRSQLNAEGDRRHRYPELARSDAAGNVTWLWPEVAMAHSDCYACHHELQSRSWRQQRGYDLRLAGGTVVGIPGRPQVRRWPLELVDWSLQGVAKDREACVRNIRTYRDKVEALYQACNQQPFGEPGKVREAARALDEWSAAVLKEQFTQARFDPAAVPDRLRQLCTLPAARYADYETARQIAAAFETLYGGWDPQASKAPGIPPLLHKLDQELNLTPPCDREARLNRLLKKVAKQTDDRLPAAGRLLPLLERVAGREYGKELDAADRAVFEQFLAGLEKVTYQDLTKDLLERDALQELSRIGDDELGRVLRQMTAYDPHTFHDRLEELCKQLPPSKE
jgi:hypothetical protein